MLIDAHGQFISTLADAERELGALRNVAEQVERLVSAQGLDRSLVLNPYTLYNIEVQPIYVEEEDTVRIPEVRTT